MFQFRRFPTYSYVFTVRWCGIAAPGFPIRISPDRSLFAAPRSFSQLITSFIGSWCQGIPLALFYAWPIVEVSLNSIQTKEWSNLLVLFRFELCRLICFTNKIVITHFLPFDFCLRHSNVSLLLPSHNLHQMSQCSVFKVHLRACAHWNTLFRILQSTQLC